MHLHISTVRRNNHVYRYVQLVESYRRSDGKPTLRVVASLGSLDDTTISNLKKALAAGREGQAVVLPEERIRHVVRRSSRYLDLAVLLELWHRTGLQGLLSAQFGPSNAAVPFEAVVASLVFQRCVAPSSKRAAEDWFPNTALPELLGITPTQFNNTRVHRALAKLDEAEAALQERLVGVAGQGALTALYLDATDTWFVGRGPPMAAKAIDKEGVYRRRVGLVLLCDQRGLPLRWHTLDGHYNDPISLLDMAMEVSKLPWVKGIPIVFDRAMGNAHAVDELVQSDLRFLTAVPAPEFGSSLARIPWQALADMQAECRHEGEPEDAVFERLGKRTLDAGFTKVHDRRYVLDLGVFAKAKAASSRVSEAQNDLRRLSIIEEMKGHTTEEMAERLGCTTRAIRTYRRLVLLKKEIRKRIQDGEGDGLRQRDLLAIAALPQDQQSTAFDTAVQDHPQKNKIRSRRKRCDQPETVSVRGVVVFNPVRFIEDREGDEASVAHLMTRIDRINRKLTSPHVHRTDASVLADATAAIRRHELGDVLDVHVEIQDGLRRLVVTRDDAKWQRRRKADGLSLLVGHSTLEGTAADIVNLYFSKDTVEKDFQSIKSFVKLRPVRHHTDQKVRAHVTVCVLALFLMRVLEDHLRAKNHPCTSQKVIELLEPVRLNLVEGDTASYYTVTSAEEDQLAMLDALEMRDLVNDTKVGARINPR